jgi:hypothetical protein
VNQPVLKKPVYYTTNSVCRNLTALLLFTPLNILLCDLLETIHPFSFLIPIALVQGYIFGMSAGYAQFGTTAPIRKKVPGIALCVILFYLLLFRNRNSGMYIISALSMLFCVFWALWYIVSAKRFSGDNSCFAEGDMDTSWFDVVHERLFGFSVLFPLDIGNYKKDRSAGHIIRIGLAVSGKYAGQPVALITSGGKQYLCLLSQVLPNQYQQLAGKPAGKTEVIDMRKRNYTVVIGIKQTEQEETICEVIFHWYAYGESCLVSYRNSNNL